MSEDDKDKYLKEAEEVWLSSRDNQGLAYGFMAAIEVAILGGFVFILKSSNTLTSPTVSMVLGMLLTISALLLLIVVGLYLSQVYTEREAAWIGKDEGRRIKQKDEMYQLNDRETCLRRLMHYFALSLLGLNFISVVLAASLL